MLEDERLEEEESYPWAGRMYNMEYYEGYYGGRKLGACEAVVRVYRNVIRKEDGKVWLDKLFGSEDIEELNRFHNRYGNISVEKMAEHLLRESEFLMFFRWS